MTLPPDHASIPCAGRHENRTAAVVTGQVPEDVASHTLYNGRRFAGAFHLIGVEFSRDTRNVTAFEVADG